MATYYWCFDTQAPKSMKKSHQERHTINKKYKKGIPTTVFVQTDNTEQITAI